MKNTKFSLILKQTRENAGLTQKQVAQALGIERSTYAYYETGTSHPNAMMVLKLAAIFNVNYMIFMDAIGDLSFDNSPENPQFTTLHDSSALDREKLYTLRDEEQNMLILYRILNSGQRKIIVKQMEAMAAENKKAME